MTATWTTPVPGNVATTLPSAHFLGTEAGPLVTPAGRGMVGGVPYGTNLQVELASLRTQYLLRPAAYGALRAATRQALGR
jgi:hypothetical protein